MMPRTSMRTEKRRGGRSVPPSRAVYDDYSTSPLSKTREIRPVRLVRANFSERKNQIRSAVLFLSLSLILTAALTDFLPSQSLLPADSRNETALLPVSSDEEEKTVPVFLTVGDYGESVRDTEILLDALGYAVSEPDTRYTAETARAVASFQRDNGLTANGICSAATLALLRHTAGTESSFRIPVSPLRISEALKASGCDPTEYGFRNALILFQRIHGLAGTGEAGYATLCALGLAGVSDGGDPEPDRSVLRDLQLTLLARWLFRTAREFPSCADLCSLSAVGHVILNRAASPLFPDSLSVLCADGLSEGKIRNAEGLFALCLRAAEDAFSASESGRDPTAGALYFSLPDAPIPSGCHVRRAIGKLIFYR